MAELLREHGHDALTIIDQEMVGELDHKVASVCKAEQRALITLDLDFSDIRTYPPGQYPGLLILRPRHQSKADVIALLLKLIPQLDGPEQLDGNLWIVQENGIRIREGA